jgi:hypothetical protein
MSLNSEDLDKFSYVNTIVDGIPCYEFLFRNYDYLVKASEKGNTILISILADLDLALQQLTKQQRYIFEQHIMYDKQIDKKYTYLISEAKNKIASFLCTPVDLTERLKEI